MACLGYCSVRRKPCGCSTRTRAWATRLYFANLRPLSRQCLDEAVIEEPRPLTCPIQPPSSRCSGSDRLLSKVTLPSALLKSPGAPHQLKHSILCVQVYCLTNKGSVQLPALIRPSHFILFPSLPPLRSLLFQLACWCSPWATPNPTKWSRAVVAAGFKDHLIFFSHAPGAKALRSSVLAVAESQAFSACNV